MPGARILLIEDDMMLSELAARILRAYGHEICLAADAENALVRLRSEAFDLLLLDINLPDQTGWELLRAAQREGLLRPLKLDGAVSRLPVVVLSAVRVSMRRLEEFQPLAYLPKPFPLEALLRLAAEAAGRRTGAVSQREIGERQLPGSLATEEELHA